MGPKPRTPESNDLFHQRLDELANPRHPLAQLEQHVDWSSVRARMDRFFPFASRSSGDQTSPGGGTAVSATHFCPIG